MLLDLLLPLGERMAPFNVVQYITFRCACAAVTGVLLSLALGPGFIRMAERFSIVEKIREEGPKGHKRKQGTPTMGGLLILAAVIVPTLLWSDLSNVYVWLAVGTTIALGAVGAVDDLIKARGRDRTGLGKKAKLGLQLAVGAALGVGLVGLTDLDANLSFPFFKTLLIELGPFYIPFVAILIAGSSNAVNLTDGLDGLAIGATLIAAATYAIFAYIAGNSIAARYLQVAYVPGAGEVAIICSALVGASLGFLWFNAHPAQMFMGDVGSLAIGGTIGAVALLAKQELLLVLVGGVFVLEALSVIVQVTSFKTTGRRVLRMSPLHHHFEHKGWKENQIIVRFWILAVLFAFLGLSTLKLR